MNNTHTPGPWIPRRWWEQAEMDLSMADEDERQDWATAPYKDIYSPTTGDAVVACHDLCEISHANANLIAAAPDLLAALESCEALICDLIDADELGDNQDLVALVRDAIAKAKGE